jgi:hypothetical protein
MLSFAQNKNYCIKYCMKKISLLILSLCMFILLHAQEKTYQVRCVAFYNLENFYDTIDAPRVSDEEFLPHGKYSWGSIKYKNKLEHMSYAISKIGGSYAPTGPTLIGVAEVENRGVLEDLVKMPALQKSNYGIAHFDSPDRRGVDVALLYNKTHFTLLASKAYPLRLAQDTAFRTRDQLLVSGLLDGEQIYVIVNHWPSRLGGEEKSRYKRVAAATLTKHIADSILGTNAQAKIVIMGDLNDDPNNESCKTVLRAKAKPEEVGEGDMYNCTWSLFKQGIGSLAYQDKWNLFDQQIISPALLGTRGTNFVFWKSQIMNLDFLTQQDGQYKGYPLRTHVGDAYLNGYSDHYPSCIYLIRVEK